MWIALLCSLYEYLHNSIPVFRFGQAHFYALKTANISYTSVGFCWCVKIKNKAKNYEKTQHNDSKNAFSICYLLADTGQWAPTCARIVFRKNKRKMINLYVNIAFCLFKKQPTQYRAVCTFSFLSLNSVLQLTNTFTFPKR